MAVGAFSQFSYLVHQLPVVLVAWESKTPPKRITQKAKALLARVNYLGLGRMQRQSSSLDPLGEQLHSLLGFVECPTQDDHVIGIAYHFKARFGHQVIQWVQVSISKQW